MSSDEYDSSDTIAELEIDSNSDDEDQIMEPSDSDQTTYAEEAAHVNEQVEEGDQEAETFMGESSDQDGSEIP